MRHLIICREYPPAPSGGIGTYAFHLSQLLAEAGETVHVIGQMWERADVRVEQQCRGRLIIHRVPFEDWASWLPRQPHPGLVSEEAKGLFKTTFPAQCFSWQASLLAEELVEKEGIDIIEAQDYEAPLYYFQLRRALGKGPKRQPPCFVHLHSPTEFIARHNQWDRTLPQVVAAKRLEDYSISAADAWLCPSRYLARQAEAHYGLAPSSVQVIPLPTGNKPWLERHEDTWKMGTICYVGRLERRKGVVEWMEAAVKTASDYPAARFEFIGDNVLGTDTMSGNDFLKQLIPDGMRSRFLFRGEQKRSSLPGLLSFARMAVVPSRWENFPNTCVEAMCAGLPVIATRNGGMAEMIEDGRTGWLASEANSESLGEALKRALDTPPTRIAEMGLQASVDIRRMCDNNTIVESHLDFRKRLVKLGARRSLRLPLSLPRLSSAESKRRKPQEHDSTGLGVVVVCHKQDQFFDECLVSIEQQTRKPVALAIVYKDQHERRASLSRARRHGWHVIHQVNGDTTAAKNAGIEAILAGGVSPLGFAFLDGSDRLEPNFIAECESTFQHCEEVGIVSSWTGTIGTNRDGRMAAPPCPAFPYQWAVNDAASFSAVRGEALKEAGSFRPVLRDGYDDWDLFTAVMAAGWVAVTIPAKLGHQRHNANSALEPLYNHSQGRIHKSILDRFPDLVALDTHDIALLVESARAQALDEKRAILPEPLASARLSLREPGRAIMLVLGRMKSKAYRASMRVLGMFKSQPVNTPGLAPAGEQIVVGTVESHPSEQ